MGVLGLTATGLQRFEDIGNSPTGEAVTAGLIEVPVPTFVEVGFGKPLTVRIEQIYTGALPKLGVLNRPKNLLVATAYKSDQFAAGNRSLNLIRKIGKSKTNISQIAATENGTNLLYAKAAVDVEAITVTIELAFDDFNESILDDLAEFLGSAAAVPVLTVASPYLLVAGQLASIGSKLANRIIDKGPDIQFTAFLNFRRTTKKLTSAGLLVLVPDEFEGAEAQYTVGKDNRLVSRVSGKEYDGDHPYVVLSVDGSELSDELKAFTPTLASAAQLSKFLGIAEGQGTDVELLISGLKALSDLRYREKAEGVIAKLRESGLGEDKKAALKAELDAYLKNIGQDALKPMP